MWIKLCIAEQSSQSSECNLGNIGVDILSDLKQPFLPVSYVEKGAFRKILSSNIFFLLDCLQTNTLFLQATVMSCVLLLLSLSLMCATVKLKSCKVIQSMTLHVSDGGITLWLLSWDAYFWMRIKINYIQSRILDPENFRNWNIEVFLCFFL